MNRTVTNIPSACRIVNIALNDAMILSHDANLGSDGIFGKDRGKADIVLFSEMSASGK